MAQEQECQASQGRPRESCRVSGSCGMGMAGTLGLLREGRNVQARKCPVFALSHSALLPQTEPLTDRRDSPVPIPLLLGQQTARYLDLAIPMSDRDLNPGSLLVWQAL